MAKIVTMGEIMLRLSTPSYQRFVQADSFDAVYGGGEANVAVSLACFGHQSSFITKVPDNPIGESAIASLRKMNVNCDDVVRGGERLGIYYLENGASVRPSKVIYDRKHSSISEAKVEEFNFDRIFEDADWFHFSGITPAISDEAVELTRAACIAAKKKGVTISVDLNYRNKLWSCEKAKSVMTDLMQYVDVCIGGREDAQKVLGFQVESSELENDEVNLAGYEKMFQQMIEKHHFKYEKKEYHIDIGLQYCSVGFYCVRRRLGGALSAQSRTECN